MTSRVLSICSRSVVVGMALVFAAIALPTHAVAPVPLIPISGMSPYPDGGDPNDPLAVTACNGGPQIGVVYRNSETEPYIAVNPKNPDNMIACWHQDRWSNGSAQGVGCAYTMDAGATWTQVIVPFTRCSGARPGAEVEFERASDPWLTFGPDGSCYYMALVSDESTPRNGMAVAKSRNGGKTWSKPTMIALHDPTEGGDDDDDDSWTGPGMIAPHDALIPGISEQFRQGWSRPPATTTPRGPFVPFRGDDGDDDDDDDGDDDDGDDDDDDQGGGGPPLYVFHDKNSMTADPYDPRYVYATWTLFIGDETRLVFSRSKNGGRKWSKFKEIARFDSVDENTFVFFRQGAQIVVLPDGTLLNAYYRILLDKTTGEFVGVDQAILRSHNRGKRWEKIGTRVATHQSTGGIDAELFFTQGIFLPVRDAGDLPDIAVNRNTGDIYIVWQDGSLRAFGASSVVISRSTDGGDTWSAPVPVHDIDDPPDLPGQSFLPSVAVADNGTVGVLFYDFRNDVFGDGPLDTDVFLSLMTPDLDRIAEKRVTADGSFDMRQMVLTGDRGYFPGDYVGLYPAGDDFVAAFTVANNLGLPIDFPQDNTVLRVDSHNRQDIVFARVSSAPVVASGEKPGELTRPLLIEGGRNALHAAAPNPFNPSTTIGFALTDAATVNLEIFDVAGRRVRTLITNERLPAGDHQVTWDGRVESGSLAATGVYLYRLMTPAFTETRRMVLLK